MLSRPPPRSPNAPKKGYGDYCIRARAKLLNKNGSEFAVITGYDVNMKIAKRVETFSARQASYRDKDYTDVEVVFLGNRKSKFEDGTIIMDYLDAKKTLVIPSIYFNEDIQDDM